MINLAKKDDCDQFILYELKKAGIRPEFLKKTSNNEVPYNIIGKLSCFEFHRAWYYWIVRGPMPLEVAKLMYNTEIGKKDIRVDGHCGCPAPEDPWLKYFDEDGHHLFNKKEIEDFPNDNRMVVALLKQKYIQWVSDRTIGKPYVTCYHIDSQEGLNLFVEFVKKYNVI